MAAPQHHGPSVLIVAGGPHSSPFAGGGAGAAGGGKAVIPIPKGFDLGDAKPGDKLDVTAHCRVSPDGGHPIVLSVDDEEADDEQDDSTKAAEGSDGDSSPGERWNKAVNGE